MMRIKTGILVTGLISMGLIASPVIQAQTLTQAQISQRVKENARSLENIQQELTRLSNQIENRAMLDLFQRVDELADEISQLRGELEVQTNDIASIKKRQRELYLDIDRRLRDLENRSSGQSSIADPALLPGTGGTDSSVVEPVDAPSDEPKTASNAEKQAYQVAFETLKEGRYRQAKESFNRFLKQYPNSIYSGNAQYWSGEANYVTRNFAQGIVEFKQVMTRYPTSSKVPDAMLKLGYTYYELKQYEDAKTILLELRERFPKSSAYRLAGNRLDRMRKEGL